MHINEFKEEKNNKRESMKEKLKDMKLENIKSLWYFVNANAKIVMGSVS